MRGTQTDSQPAESRSFTWLRWQHTPSRGTGLRGDLNSRRVEGWQTQGLEKPTCFQQKHSLGLVHLEQLEGRAG